MRHVPAASGTKAAALRGRAERLIQATPAEIADVRIEDVQQLVDELQVHQAKLGGQNEDLLAAQSELAHARDRYRHLYEFAPVAYLTVDETMVVREANLTAVTLLATERVKLVGGPFLIWVAEECRNSCHVVVRRAIDAATREVCELWFVRSDGSRFFGRLEAAVGAGRQPPAPELRITINDITEHERGREQLTRAKRQWERTFDSVPNLIAAIDSEFRIVQANRALADRLGLTPAQCVGMPCHRAVHGTDAPPENCPHAKLLADRRQHTVELHDERLGGDFLVTCSPLVDTDGRLMGSVHVARNVTERVRSERRLRLLSEVTARLLSADHPQQIVESLCRKVMEHIGSSAFFNYLVEEQTGRLHLNAYAGVPEETARRLEWLDLGTTICAWVAREGARWLPGTSKPPAIRGRKWPGRWNSTPTPAIRC